MRCSTDGRGNEEGWRAAELMKKRVVVLPLDQRHLFSIWETRHRNSCPRYPSNEELPFQSLLRKLPNILSRFTLVHLEDRLVDLASLEIFVRLRSFFELHRSTAQPSDLLLLLYEQLEGVFEDAADGAPAEGSGDVFAVEEEAVDFPRFGADEVLAGVAERGVT